MTDLSASASSASDTGVCSPRGGLSQLGVEDVHLWLCSRDGVASSDDFKRRVLSRYAPVAPCDWQFTANEQGKPALAETTQALDFNLSHSGDWLACAVTAGTPVGVDLEYCNPHRVTMKLARRFFHPQEVAALQDCSEAVQQDRFYDYWTLKEAAVKARGLALAPGLQTRCFKLTFPAGSESGSGRIVVITKDDTDNAHYWLLDPLAGYRVAICCLPATALLPQLTVFELRAGDEINELILAARAISATD